MTTELEQAAGSILAMILGGVILLKAAPILNSTSTINFAAWGALYLLVGIVSVVLITYATMESIIN